MLEVCTLEELLLEFGLGDLDLDGLVDLLLVSSLVVGIVLDRGREKGVDESSLAQSRFTSNLYHPSQLTRASTRSIKLTQFIP